MLYVCTVYLFYFGIAILNQTELKNGIPDNSFELYSFKGYLYSGCIVSALALIGVLWRKYVFLLPLMVYEVCLLIFRMETLRSVLLSQSKMNEKNCDKEIMLLVIGMYMMVLQYSYYRELLNENNSIRRQPTIIAHQTVSRIPPSAPCVIDVPVCGQFSDTPYPIEYTIQPPYAKPHSENRMYVGQIPPVYPPFPGGSIHDTQITMAQSTLQPFPHGAPPPYTENPPPYAS